MFSIVSFDIIVLPSTYTVSLVFGRLLLRSLGTIGFRDVTETNGWQFIPVTSPRSTWKLMTMHMERERGLVTRQVAANDKARLITFTCKMRHINIKLLYYYCGGLLLLLLLPLLLLLLLPLLLLLLLPLLLLLLLLLLILLLLLLHITITVIIIIIIIIIVFFTWLTWIL